MAGFGTGTPGAVTAAGTETPVHPFPAAGRDWPETNCYVDLWIELLHANRLEVAAMLGFTVACDYEYDQWTFYKPRASELELLYGLEIEELTLWKPLLPHLVEQVSRGRVPLVEADAFYLPDTAGRDYGQTHTKTTIGVLAIDAERETLEYLHNRSRFGLSGKDFRGLLRLDPVPPEQQLPPYCEIVKVDRLIRRSGDDLRALARQLLEHHRARCPESNPIARYADAVAGDLAEIAAGGGDTYDVYAFAGIRQCGSGFAFAADHLRWLGVGEEVWEDAAEAFAGISSIASLLVMKMARIAHSGRQRDLSDSFAEMASAWERGMAALDRALAT
jgi:hypothetical protein